VLSSAFRPKSSFLQEVAPPDTAELAAISRGRTRPEPLSYDAEGGRHSRGSEEKAAAMLEGYLAGGAGSVKPSVGLT